MAIDLFWDDDEQSVLLAEFNGKWTWDELHKVLSKVKLLSHERNRTFGAILDLRKGMHFPGGTIFNREGLEQFKRLIALGDDERKGPVVILGMNNVVKMIFDAVGNFDKSLVSDVACAQNESDARRKIYADVENLNGEATA